MGSDFAMHPPTWDQLTTEEKRRMNPRERRGWQEEQLAIEEFQKWYKESVATSDDPTTILLAWRAYWAGYCHHRKLDLEKYR